MSTGEGAGSGAGTEFATARGHDYPSIRQFTVFLENRVGQLMDVVRRFEGSNVRIVALTISDSTECALVRFLLSDPEAGREILERAGGTDLTAVNESEAWETVYTHSRGFRPITPL